MTHAEPGAAQLSMALAVREPIVTFASPDVVPTRDLTRITIRRRDTQDGSAIAFRGRPAWALGQLIRAGQEGCTPITHPGPRWSHYVWVLKRDGALDIETVHQGHGGPYSGHHARYVLRSPIEVLAIEEVEAQQ